MLNPFTNKNQSKKTQKNLPYSTIYAVSNSANHSRIFILGEELWSCETGCVVSTEGLQILIVIIENESWQFVQCTFSPSS